MKTSPMLLSWCRGLFWGGRPLPSATGAGRRGLATTVGRQKESDGGLFGNFFQRKPADVEVTPSSSAFATKERIIELQTHNVKPDSLDRYLNAHRNLVEFFEANQTQLHCQAVGNFRVFVGDEDQYIHLWRYDEGYAGIDKTLALLRHDADYQALHRDIVPLLRNRHSQYLLPFSFWPEMTMRPPGQGQQAQDSGRVYELRSYHLKPGTMLEWGNYWARAIRMRDYKHSEAFLGCFSQVGELHNVKHVWCYDSLEDRKQAREVVWHKQQSQWSEIVTHTIPLVRHMTSRIMRPLHHSPTH